MQKDSWILLLIIFIIGLLLVALLIALLKQKRVQKSQAIEKIPSAQELLELLKQKDNTLAKLASYSTLAKAHYMQYMQEIPNFDLEAVAILTAHKNVNSKLILEVEKYFKSLNPSRKELLDKALSIGLSKR